MPKQPVGVDLAFQYNMFYKALQNRTIQLGPKETVEFNTEVSVVFVPQPKSKIFLHWFTDSGKLRQTYTMTFPTKVDGQFKIINGLDSPTAIQVIHLD